MGGSIVTSGTGEWVSDILNCCTWSGFFVVAVGSYS